MWSEKLLVFLPFFSFQLSVILCCLLIVRFYRTSPTIYTVHMASVVQPSDILLVLCSLEIVFFNRILFRTGISTADLSPHVSLKYYSVVLITLWTYIVICKHFIIIWKTSKLFNVYTCLIISINMYTCIKSNIYCQFFLFSSVFVHDFWFAVLSVAPFGTEGGNT